MNEKIFKTLEFDKVLSMLAEEASSEAGRARCLALKPQVSKTEIEKLGTQTEDALQRAFRETPPEFRAVKDFKTLTIALEAEAVLGMGELLSLAYFLENTGQVKQYGASREEADSLTPFFEILEPVRSLSTEILRCIADPETMYDDASSELKRIRQGIGRAEEKVRSELTKIVNNSREFLQDAVVTMRNDRFCIPVKAEYAKQLPGMVHDTSGSGSTYFIEPASVVNLNNQIRELQIAEKKEMERILQELSIKASAYVEEIRENVRVMIILDVIFAKGRLALKMNAVKPVLREDSCMNLKGARHPLLDPKKVVPIDVSLGEDFDLLVITGPNTGGKTVTLKTVGLLCLMGQAGLHIPAKSLSSITVFTEIYADIGDEQSIEQSLSTFSGHIKSIVEILARANRRSLCLFDELGAGTDPIEGAALAQAILEDLHRRHIRTLATTHYSELKTYALETEGVENASCEFDVETLKPTYRLIIGLPGKSNAFAIAEKLGIPSQIIKAAEKHIDRRDKGFEDIIAELDKRRSEMEVRSKELEQLEEESGKLKEKLSRQNEKMTSARERILSEANREARELLQEAKRIADEGIKSFRNIDGNTTIRQLEDQRAKIRKALDKTGNSAVLGDGDQAGLSVPPEKLRLGDTVKIVNMGLTGEIVSLPDKKGNCAVMCGSLRTQTKAENLLFIKHAKKQEEAPKRTVATGPSKAMSISPEINLIGMTTDEALYELDKYLDDAYLSGIPSVRIVHGKGSGILRDAVRRRLRKVQYVESFRAGEFGEGDAGVTVAVFRA